MGYQRSKLLYCRPAPLSSGAPFPGAELAPQALLAGGLAALFGEQSMLLPGVAEALPPITTQSGLAAWLAQHAAACASAVAQGGFPLVLGGDHSVAAATWRGVGRALGLVPALLWIDAHLDAHTPASSPSGNLHGMPLAALLGYGDSVLNSVSGPLLRAEHVAVIGAHSFEAEEAALLARLGVRICSRAEVGQRGLAVVVNEVLSAWGERPWGVSLDIDVLDPRYAPGVSTPAPGGLSDNELLCGIAGLCRRSGCVAGEVVELNPLRDVGGRSLAMAQAICRSLLAAA